MANAIDVLTGIHDQITDWLAATEPVDGTANRTRGDIAVLADQLETTIQNLALAAVTLAGLDVDGKVRDLQALSAEMAATAATLDKATQVLGIVNQVVGVALSIAAMAAGA